jgi:hypothetical protein
MSVPSTPGPWSICKNHPDWICAPTGGYPIAMVPPGQGAGAAANARLIATAPEMLEALEALLAHRECPVHSPEVKVARAVAAKARGELR